MSGILSILIDLGMVITIRLLLFFVYLSFLYIEMADGVDGVDEKFLPSSSKPSSSEEWNFNFGALLTSSLYRKFF